MEQQNFDTEELNRRLIVALNSKPFGGASLKATVGRLVWGRVSGPSTLSRYVANGNIPPRKHDEVKDAILKIAPFILVDMYKSLLENPDDPVVGFGEEVANPEIITGVSNG